MWNLQRGDGGVVGGGGGGGGGNAIGPPILPRVPEVFSCMSAPG